MMDKLLNDIAPASTTDVAEEKTVDAGTEIAPGAEAAPESDPVTLGGTAVSPGAPIGPVIGAHSGPDTVAVFFLGQDAEGRLNAPD